MQVSRSKEFELELLACAQELNPVIERLVRRYPPVTVVGALAIQVSTNVRTLIEQGICTRQSARDVLRRLERAALDAASSDAARRSSEV